MIAQVNKYKVPMLYFVHINKKVTRGYLVTIMRGERIQINEKLLQYTVYKGSVSKLCLFSDVFMKIINKTL